MMNKKAIITPDESVEIPLVGVVDAMEFATNSPLRALYDVS
jgi:hypothetical protein